MAPSESAYLTVDQVADMLQVSGATVYRWIERDPSFPALRVHGVVRVPRARLETWLGDRTQGRRPRHLTRNQAPVPAIPPTCPATEG